MELKNIIEKTLIQITKLNQKLKSGNNSNPEIVAELETIKKTLDSDASKYSKKYPYILYEL